jgi:phosphoribosylformylglycinamidine synthase I
MARAADQRRSRQAIVSFGIRDATAPGALADKPGPVDGVAFVRRRAHVHSLSGGRRASSRAMRASRRCRANLEMCHRTLELGRGHRVTLWVVATSAPRIAVVQFPGTNCERETARALTTCWGGSVDVLWHAVPFPVQEYAAVVLPGGFAYGDHLRAGAIARFSRIMPGIQEFAERGGFVLGICNGFQVLLEAGLLPGAMLRNASLQFRSEWVWCRVERTDTPFTATCHVGQLLRLPIAHGEGNYVCLDRPEGVALRYCDADGNVTATANPNGSLDGIAGLANARGNVFGLMPHPERAADPLLGSTDGCFIFESLAWSLRAPAVA